jgi:hypothetical protein
MTNKEQAKKPDSELTNEDELLLDEKEKPVEIISLDIGEEGEETPGLDEETTLELLQQAQKEAYSEEIAEHTDDEATQDAFEARQELDAGSKQLARRLEQHHAKSPGLSAGDLDAGWDKANVGDETAGGTAATPDQDRVDEYGEAYGINYEDDEPLQTEEKLAERDRQRWELDPESAEED